LPDFALTSFCFSSGCIESIEQIIPFLLPQRTQRSQRNRVEISVSSVLSVVHFCFLQQSHAIAPAGRSRIQQIRIQKAESRIQKLPMRDGDDHTPKPVEVAVPVPQGTSSLREDAFARSAKEPASAFEIPSRFLQPLPHISGQIPDAFGAFAAGYM
jgi:hypothetical protein